jgi:hypothetical protein
MLPDMPATDAYFCVRRTNIDYVPLHQAALDVLA